MSAKIQVGLDNIGFVEIRKTVRDSEPKSVRIDIYDIPTVIFALTDLLDEGRERANDYYQRYLNIVARSEDSNEQQSSAGLEDVTPL